MIKIENIDCSCSMCTLTVRNSYTFYDTETNSLIGQQPFVYVWSVTKPSDTCIPECHPYLEHGQISPSNNASLHYKFWEIGNYRLSLIILDSKRPTRWKLVDDHCTVRVRCPSYVYIPRGEDIP